MQTIALIQERCMEHVFHSEKKKIYYGYIYRL